MASWKHYFPGSYRRAVLILGWVPREGCAFQATQWGGLGPLPLYQKGCSSKSHTSWGKGRALLLVAGNSQQGSSFLSLSFLIRKHGQIPVSSSCSCEVSYNSTVIGLSTEQAQSKCSLLLYFSWYYLTSPLSTSDTASLSGRRCAGFGGNRCTSDRSWVLGAMVQRDKQ